MWKVAQQIANWAGVMLGPISYVLPMALPLLVGVYWLDPWVEVQGWPGWTRLIFWMLYTGISTGITFALTIIAVQAIKDRRRPKRL